jgi:putative transposase
MPEFRGADVPGGAFFFTVVTYRRRPILRSAAAVALLRRCIAAEQRRRPFILDAAANLPDHLHMLWTPPRGDADFSVPWRRIRETFTRGWRTVRGE